MSSPVRFAVGVVAAIVVLTGVLFVIFASNPVAIGVWMARSAFDRSGFEKATVDATPGVQTYFHGGAGPKTVVLLHGLGHQAGAWIKTTTDLSDRHAVIVPDLAGHGESEPLNGPLTLDDSIAGLDAVLDAAASKGRVVLVGNSLGGWVAVRYALAHPERVERLILVNASGLTEGPAVDPLPNSRDAARDFVRAITPGTAPEPAGFVLDDLVDSIHDGAAPRQMRGLRDADYLDHQLGELAVPVDVVWGLEDGLLPPSHGARFVELLGGAERYELDSCGHIPPQQCAPAFNRLLYRLLEQPASVGEVEAERPGDAGLDPAAVPPLDRVDEQAVNQD